MKQFLINAWDGKDDEAIDRRMTARYQHLAGAKKLKESGNFILGGAMLDDDGKMIGSTLVLQFENDGDFEEWKSNEIYILNKVWDRVEVCLFKVADI